MSRAVFHPLKVTSAALLLVTLGLPGAQAAPDPAPWRGVHLMAPGHDDLPLLKRALEEGLKPLGVNVLVLEVNYRFDYRSHPELRDSSYLTREDAAGLAAHCKRLGMRLIPMFNCLGHQSWAKHTYPLLKAYPRFDETPEVPADNKGIYCRSWCPSNPEVNTVVFPLIDELIDAFKADAFHVGMDEVFLVGGKHCERCKGKDPAELFARAVNDLHEHVAGRRKLTMLMWADRLIDDRTAHYGEWEASRNGTAPAIDRIPKDIILCDWHYTRRSSYPSLALFESKGFPVWPSSWNKPDAALAFLEAARGGGQHGPGRVIGHLATTWMSPRAFCRALLDPKDEATAGARGAQGVVQALRVCMKALDEPPKERWISLFNGKDLEGWTPKIKGSDLGVNYRDTFRVEDGLLKVSYDRYPSFHGEFGHLFYKQPFAKYRLRIEYRFVGDQVKDGPGWAFRNSGVMIHCQKPESMGKDQEFPVSIEVQFLGGAGKGKRPTGNLCTPGTNVVMDGKLITQHCTESKSKTYDGDVWVTMETEVHGDGVIKHFVDGQLVLQYEKPQYDPRDRDAARLIKGPDLSIPAGYISLQAESHPIEFRKVEILPLED